MLWNARKMAIPLFFFLLVLLVPAQASATRTIGLSTGAFDFSLAAGKSGSGEVTVMDNGDENLSVLIYAANQRVSDTGAITYEVPNRDDQGLQYNPASWLRLQIGKSTQALGNTPYIEMKPGEKVNVAFDLTVPEGTPPGDHQILLFFEMMSDAKATQGQATPQVSGRVGARIKVRVAGDVVEKVEVRPFVAKGFILGQAMPYTFVIHNGGNTDKPIKAKLLLLDSNLSEVMSSDVATEAVVYAGANVEYDGVMRTAKQLIGKYTLRLQVEYPREGSTVAIPETVEINKTVWILPLWLAIAIVVVVGMALIWASWRASVRSAEKRMRREKRLSTGVPVGDENRERDEV